MYGIPCAGMILDALRKVSQSTALVHEIPRHRLIRTLSVFVTFLDWSATPTSANYPIRNRVLQILSKLLDAIIDGALPGDTEEHNDQNAHQTSTNETSAHAAIGDQRSARDLAVGAETATQSFASSNDNNAGAEQFSDQMDTDFHLDFDFDNFEVVEMLESTEWGTAGQRWVF